MKKKCYPKKTRIRAVECMLVVCMMISYVKGTSQSYTLLEDGIFLAHNKARVDIPALRAILENELAKKVYESPVSSGTWFYCEVDGPGFDQSKKHGH